MLLRTQSRLAKPTVIHGYTNHSSIGAIINFRLLGTERITRRYDSIRR